MVTETKFGLFNSATGAGLARLVSFVQLLYSDDELYYIADVGLWGIGEITAGFLIIGIPGLPKVTQSIRSSTYFVSLISRLRGTTVQSQSAPSSDRLDLRTWGQGSRPRRRGLWEISDVDSYALATVTTEGMAQKPEHETPPHTILRETRVDVEHGHPES